MRCCKTYYKEINLRVKRSPMIVEIKRESVIKWVEMCKFHLRLLRKRSSRQVRYHYLLVTEGNTIGKMR